MNRNLLELVSVVSSFSSVRHGSSEYQFTFVTQFRNSLGLALQEKYPV